MVKSRPCYHCQSNSHRAKDCPLATCTRCGEQGHNAGSCPQKPSPSVDMGAFLSPPTSSKPTYIELFAGIGGFRLALDRLGMQCVFASEIDRFARANYELNYSDRPAGDITQISAWDIPDHDLLVGGFPCQAFSFSGNRRGFDDERGVLFLEIVRILKVKKPKALLLENVRGLLTHDDGRTLATILLKLQECGYQMRYEILDAVHLLPQERKRIYLVGIRKDLAPLLMKPFSFPNIPNLGRGFHDIVERRLAPKLLEKLPLSQHQLEKVLSQSYTQRFPDARFLADLGKPTKTLQSSYASYMVGSQFVPHNNELDSWRRLSPREAARLQGFPESFQLCTERPYHLLGNAVVPSIIALVIAPVMPILDSTVPMHENDDRGWDVAMSLLMEASPNDDRRCALQKKVQASKLEPKEGKH